MSTMADVLPYMQHWLDSRAPETQAKADFAAARSAMATARNAIAARVGAGDTAIQMTALMTTYAAARVTYFATDIAARTAIELTKGRFERFEQMVDLLVNGQDVPPFTP
jgi:hypothetical protein